MKDVQQPLALVVSEDGTRFDARTRLEIGSTSDRIIGLVDPHVAHLIDSAAVHHVRSNRLVDAVTLLVKDVAPPVDDRSVGMEVTSFLASGAIAASLHQTHAPLEQWCYLLMHHILAQHRVTCECRVVHKRQVNAASLSTTSCDVVVPHRGSEAYLRLSVDSLLRQKNLSRIVVAIDQADAGAGFLADIANRAYVDAYQLTPCPIGPYVARHALSLRSQADAVAFQDSDDMSLPHRLATLATAADRLGAGIVGSHELQVHESQRKVYAIRYPLDVNASLHRAGANHQLLLPTALVRHEVFERVGGFSTFRDFSLDVSFWLSASLHTKIINVDDFLYIRRRHPTSLTMRSDIGTGSAVRKRIVAQRCSDFAAIRDGRLRLEDSSLAVRHTTNKIVFTDVKTGETITPRF